MQGWTNKLGTKTIGARQNLAQTLGIATLRVKTSGTETSEKEQNIGAALGMKL